MESEIEKSLVKTGCGHDVIRVRPGSGISARNGQLLVCGIFNCHSANLGLAWRRHCKEETTKRGQINNQESGEDICSWGCMNIVPEMGAKLIPNC